MKLDILYTLYMFCKLINECIQIEELVLYTKIHIIILNLTLNKVNAYIFSVSLC